MEASWGPERTASTKRIAINRLQKIKQELEEEKSRRSSEKNFLVPIDYHNQFSVSLEDLRRVGVDIPMMFNSRVDEENDVQVRGNYILDRVVDVLDWIESQPTEPPPMGS